MITVVIPLYNKSHTIVNTLNSVLNQSFTNFELVIVNDGSTDNSIEIIENYFHDIRIKVINQSNEGVSAARNRGVKEAKYNYIAFLDGDDEWFPEYLNTIKKMIESFPHAGLYLTGGIVGSIKHKDFVYRIAKKYVGKILEVNLFENPEVFSHSSATVISKEFFSKTHGYINNMCQFEDFLASQAIALISQVIYCGLPLSKYNGDVEGQLTKQNIINRIKAMDSVVLYYNTIVSDYYKSSGSNKIFLIYMKYNIRHLVKNLLINSDFKSLDYYRVQFDLDVWSLLWKVERFIYFNKLKTISILWINITKLIWRLNFFPRIGQNFNINSLPIEFRLRG
jgi:glycosyltransferase involved in cell wall biosynthesis